MSSTSSRASTLLLLVSILAWLGSPPLLYAQDDLSELTAKGRELYFARVSCWVCHGDNAEGRVGPSLQFGPTPMDIRAQLDSNPQMTIIVSELNPTAEDLVALATFIGSLTGHAVAIEQITAWRSQLAETVAVEQHNSDFVVTPRDRLVMQIESFDTVLSDWQRRAKVGSLKRDYDVKVLATYEAGDPVFRPRPGGVYFYENTGGSAARVLFDEPRRNTSQIVAGDATTKEILAHLPLPEELRGAVHTTVLSPDARYVYIVGPSADLSSSGETGGAELRTSATLLKVDAKTLKPIKQLAVGGRLHHGQIFRDRYLLIDTFASDPDGLDVFLFDPESDRILGGIRGSDLGGRNYTSYTDNEFIYVLMQPGGFGEGGPGSRGPRLPNTVRRPYWVAKIDPETWEVVAEYPFPGYRGDWIVIDSRSEFIYVPAALSYNVSKINLATGAIEWSAPTGIGPYGAALNADETELWVTDKGESNGQFGRTVTVVEAATGRPLHTLFSGYQGDHVLLSPDGKEMWATSNGEGRIYVFDAASHEQTHVIDMPYQGQPHGLVWVAYDEHGVGRVVRDQGGFHNGIHPARGRPLAH